MGCGYVWLPDYKVWMIWKVICRVKVMFVYFVFFICPYVTFGKLLLGKYIVLCRASDITTEWNKWVFDPIFVYTMFPDHEVIYICVSFSPLAPLLPGKGRSCLQESASGCGWLGCSVPERDGPLLPQRQPSHGGPLAGQTGAGMQITTTRTKQPQSLPSSTKHQIRVLLLLFNCKKIKIQSVCNTACATLPGS